jgi:surfeit locus 1 family protein
VNEERALTSRAADLVPPVAALVLVLLFTCLGFWQLDRAEQKQALQESFENAAERASVTDDLKPALYQPIAATGHYLGERQFLIDNMVQDGRLGYYVITPLELAPAKPLLLVNRGWLAGLATDRKLPSIAVGALPQTVTGRAGRLPRAVIRPGAALRAGDWPKVATFPTTAELGRALGRPVLPYVLLADPEPGVGLVRRWQPQQMGPARHIGYAFQWFALALTVVVVAVVLYRRQRAGR